MPQKNGFYFESGFYLSWANPSLQPLLGLWKQNTPYSVDKCLNFAIANLIYRVVHQLAWAQSMFGLGNEEVIHGACLVSGPPCITHLKRQAMWKNA